MAQHSPGLWHAVEFSTHRTGTRRTELRRLLSLAAWAQRFGRQTRALALSARVPADCQPAALKAVASIALAAAPTLEHLSLTTNRGFWPGWLPALRALRRLALCSKEGGLSLHGDLTGLSRLTRLELAARHAVSLADSLQLPPSLAAVELGAIRDTLPPALAQLQGLRRLAVRRSLLSEGVLLTEYEALAGLTGARWPACPLVWLFCGMPAPAVAPPAAARGMHTGRPAGLPHLLPARPCPCLPAALTSLALEAAEDEAWLLPPELEGLTCLCSLSIAGNNCS